MSRYLSTIVTLLLLLGLGALALVALSGTASNTMAAVTDLSSTAPGAQGDGELDAAAALAPDALSSTESFNFIALPLDVTASISPFKASGLAAYHGGSVKQVLIWNAATQQMVSYSPGFSPPFADFDLAIAGAYFLVLDSTSTNTLTLVGDVPDEGSITFSLVKGATTDNCAFNALSIPLDRPDLTTASELATDVGGVLQVLGWNASTQQMLSYSPGFSPPFANFAVQIGYPYFVCVNSAGPATWPTY